jgi:D-ribose pyranose/furanose isomerase RbsD
MEKMLYEGAVEKLDLIFNERIKRFKQLANKMEKSIELYRSIMGNEVSEELINQKRELFENIQKIESSFNECLAYSGDEKKRVEFLKNIDDIYKKTGKDYINVIQNLNEYSIKVGTSWLLSMVENTRNTILKYLPSFI